MLLSCCISNANEFTDFKTEELGKKHLKIEKRNEQHPTRPRKLHNVYHRMRSHTPLHAQARCQHSRVQHKSLHKRRMKVKCLYLFRDDVNMDISRIIVNKHPQGDIKPSIKQARNSSAAMYGRPGQRDQGLSIDCRRCMS